MPYLFKRGCSAVCLLTLLFYTKVFSQEATLKRLNTISKYSSIWNYAVSADQNHLVFTEQNKGLKVIDLQSRDVLKQIVDTNLILVKFHPIDKTFFVGTKDGKVLRLNLDLYAVGLFICKEEKAISKLEISPNGKILAVQTRSSNICELFDLSKGKKIGEIPNLIQSGHTQTNFQFSKDSKVIVHMAEEMPQKFKREKQNRGRAIGIWNISKRKDVKWVYLYDNFSISKQFLYYGTRSKKYSINRLNLETLEIDTLDTNSRGMHFLKLFATPNDSFLIEYDFEQKGIRKYNCANKLYTDLGKGTRSRFLSFTKGANEFLAATQNNRLQVWSLLSNKLLSTFETDSYSQIYNAHLNANLLTLYVSEKQETYKICPYSIILTKMIPNNK